MKYFLFSFAVSTVITLLLLRWLELNRGMPVVLVGLITFGFTTGVLYAVSKLFSLFITRRGTNERNQATTNSSEN